MGQYEVSVYRPFPVQSSDTMFHCNKKFGFYLYESDYLLPYLIKFNPDRIFLVPVYYLNPSIE